MPDSFGHGLGSETMDPVTVGDKQVTLEVGSITDYDTEVRQITIDLSETSTRELIKETTFSVELIKGNETLLVNNFEQYIQDNCIRLLYQISLQTQSDYQR